MGIPTATLLRRAGVHLLDTDHERWKVDELIDWINEGARAIVSRRYDAGSSTENVALVAGSKQTLAADVFRLIDITRNRGTGNDAGRVVKRVDRQLLDVSDPLWHSKTAAAITRQYVYDEKFNPSVFYVSPPAISGNYLEAIVSRFPAEVTSADGQEVDMTDEFQEPLLNFMLYRCYAKDSEYGDPSKAVAHYQAFTASLGADAPQDGGPQK